MNDIHANLLDLIRHSLEYTDNQPRFTDIEFDAGHDYERLSVKDSETGKTLYITITEGD